MHHKWKEIIDIKRNTTNEKIVGNQLLMKIPIEFKDKLCCRSGVPIAKSLATLISYSPYGILIS
jgi:hypothetical protein